MAPAATPKWREQSSGTLSSMSLAMRVRSSWEILCSEVPVTTVVVSPQLSSYSREGDEGERISREDRGAQEKGDSRKKKGNQQIHHHRRMLSSTMRPSCSCRNCNIKPKSSRSCTETGEGNATYAAVTLRKQSTGQLPREHLGTVTMTQGQACQAKQAVSRE